MGGEHAEGHQHQPWAFVLPLFGLIHIGLFLVAAAMISLVNHGAIFDWTLPADVPLWAAVLALFVGDQVVVSPFRVARHWAWRPGAGAAGGLFAFWYAAIWLTGMAVAVWIASNNLGEIREFLQHLPQVFRDFMLAMRELLDR